MLLEISKLTTFSDIASLLQLQKATSIIFWEAAVSMTKKWAVFMTVILGPAVGHPMVYKLMLLIKVVEEVIT